MAAKNYNLKIDKSDGTSENILFSIPDQEGTYSLKFTMSDGSTINAGNVTVNDTENVYDLKLTLSNGNTLNVGRITTPIAVHIPSVLADATWAQIAEASEAGEAANYWAVGDEKTITLTTGEQVTFVILGFNHDNLSDGSGKAGITFGMKGLLDNEYQMKASSNNSGGWRMTDMRTKHLPTILSQLPTDLQSVIKAVDKETTSGSGSRVTEITSDKLFLLSETEINDLGDLDAHSRDEGEMYEYWKREDLGDGYSTRGRIKRHANGTGDADFWWLRSPSLNEYSGYNTKCFMSVNTMGQFLTNSTPSGSRCVCFCFCV